MNYERWKDIAEMIGIVSIVVSLIFVGLEVRQTGQIAAREMLDRYRDGEAVFRTLIGENADVWQRGCMGEQLTAGEQVLFSKIFGTWITRRYSSWVNVQQSNPAGIDPLNFPYGVAANLHRFPGLHTLFEALERWTVLSRSSSAPGLDLFNRAISERMVQLVELEPDPLSDARFCGV